MLGQWLLMVLAAVGLLCAQWGSEWWPLLLLAAVGVLGWAAPFRLADGAVGGPRWRSCSALPPDGAPTCSVRRR